MKNRSLKNKISIIVTYTIFLLIFELFNANIIFAADPKLINTLKGAFEKIESYIMKLATPIAAVAIGSGALMKKFSFGDEEKIRTGKKLIRGSIFSYGFVLCTDMILSLVSTLVK